MLADAVRAIGLGALVTPSDTGLLVTHLPMILTCEPGDDPCSLEGHVARPNPHWRVPIASPPLAIFQGPHAYVSPSWYVTKRQHGKVVPTWNYIAVHAHGTLEAVDDQAWLLAHLDDLTRANEAGRAQPWAVSDAPEDYVHTLSRAIVGLRLNITSMEGAWKLIQHRSEGGRLGTIAGLDTEPAGQAVAAAMRKQEAERQP